MNIGNCIKSNFVTRTFVHNFGGIQLKSFDGFCQFSDELHSINEAEVLIVSSFIYFRFSLQVDRENS